MQSAAEAMALQSKAKEKANEGVNAAKTAKKAEEAAAKAQLLEMSEGAAFEKTVEAEQQIGLPEGDGAGESVVPSFVLEAREDDLCPCGSPRADWRGAESIADPVAHVFAGMDQEHGRGPGSGTTKSGQVGEPSRPVGVTWCGVRKPGSGGVS